MIMATQYNEQTCQQLYAFLPRSSKVVLLVERFLRLNAIPPSVELSPSRVSPSYHEPKNKQRHQSTGQRTLTGEYIRIQPQPQISVNPNPTPQPTNTKTSKR